MTMFKRMTKNAQYVAKYLLSRQVGKPSKVGANV